MRIAIVGAGVSGLVAAHLLDPEHEVTVFEAAGYAGGHTNTVRVDTANETHHVDTGFIVFNDRNYPNFERLLERLGVATQPSTMTFGVSDGRGDFEYNGSSPNGLFAKRAHLVTPWFHRMVADLARFNRAARELLRRARRTKPMGRHSGSGSSSSASAARSSSALIVPQASAVWSADPRQMWTFPARFLVEFFDNHGMLSFRGRPRWRTVSGGSARYVEALLSRFRGRLRLSTPVQAVRRGADDVLVTPRGGEPERFDEVVLATHSDQALALLADASDARAPAPGRDPLPAQRGGAAHRHLDAAAPPARLGELELPPPRHPDGADHRHLPHEPPPVAARRAGVLRDAQPDARRSTRRR